MSLADRFQVWNRQRKVEWLANFIEAHDVHTVLFVGVSGPPRAAWENMVERAAGSLATVVWSGLSPQTWCAPFVVADGLRLPFDDQSFDLVYSNAVIEHVGNEEAQVSFISEHARVGRHWAATTPNRWFPVESHTRTPLRHWSPRWRAARPEFTRLLSRSELEAIAPNVHGGRLAPTFTAWG